MKPIFTYLLFILLLSCNNNRQKELELKEKELELKEKELALKEKNLTSVDTTKTKEPEKVQPTTATINHADFKTFWSDFKNAVLTNNKSEVLKMTKIPFLDGYENDVYFKNDGLKPLSCRSASEFYKKYDMIFNSQVIKAIKEDKVRGEKSEYYIYIGMFNNRPFDLLFKRQGGVFKLTSIPFFS